MWQMPRQNGGMLFQLPAVSQGPIHGRRINGLNKRWMLSLEKTFGLRLGHG